MRCFYDGKSTSSRQTSRCYRDRPWILASSKLLAPSRAEIIFYRSCIIHSHLTQFVGYCAGSFILLLPYPVALLPLRANFRIYLLWAFDNININYFLKNKKRYFIYLYIFNLIKNAILRYKIIVIRNNETYNYYLIILLHILCFYICKCTSIILYIFKAFI